MFKLTHECLRFDSDNFDAKISGIRCATNFSFDHFSLNSQRKRLFPKNMIF